MAQSGVAAGAWTKAGAQPGKAISNLGQIPRSLLSEHLPRHSTWRFRISLPGALAIFSYLPKKARHNSPHHPPHRALNSALEFGDHRLVDSLASLTRVLDALGPLLLCCILFVCVYLD